MPARRLLLAIALLLSIAACSSSSGGGGSSGNHTSGPPSVVPTSHHGAPKSVDDVRALLLRHVPGNFKQESDTTVNADTSITAAAQLDGRKPAVAAKKLARVGFLRMYQRRWTGLGNTQVTIVLEQFRVVGGAQGYAHTEAEVLRRNLDKVGKTAAVKVPGIADAQAFTTESGKSGTTIVVVSSHTLVMQIRQHGLQLGQTTRAMVLATRQFARL